MGSIIVSLLLGGIEKFFAVELEEWVSGYIKRKGMLDDRNIQTAAFNEPAGAANKLLHEHGGNS